MVHNGAPSPHSALAKLQILTMFLLVHAWVTGACIKGELNALEIDGVQNRLQVRVLCTSLCILNRVGHLRPLLARGKEPKCPQPPGLLHQAIKIDCQKLKEDFISSLTCQSDNWCLLQVQGTLETAGYISRAWPVLSTLLNPKPLQSLASKAPNPGFATCNTELTAR